MVRIPSEYQEVEYLESTGKQYVQTSYTPQNTDEIICDFSIIGSIVGLSNAQALFSAGTGTTQLILLLCHYDGANPVNGAYYKYFASGGAKQFNFYPSYNSKYRLTISNGTAFCNGYSVQSAYEGVVNTSLHLMRRANNASPFFGRLYNFVLSNSGIKKLDLIPCYRKSDNKPGMYDTVSKTFYTNSGTGEFLVGNNVHYDTTNLLESRRRILLTTPHLESPTPANPLTFKSNMTTKLKEGKVYFTPVQEGTGDPSPDNVRPISGWDGITVTKCGKNLFSGEQIWKLCTPDASISEDENGRYVNPGSVVNFINFPDGIFKEKTQYTFIMKTYASTGIVFYAVLYSDGVTRNITAPAGLATFAIVTAAGKTVKGIRPMARSGTRRFYYEESGVFEGNLTTDAYEPYTGTTITIPFPKTIYGGYVDLVNGEVVEEYDGIDLSTVGFYQYNTSNHCWSSAIPEMVTGNQLTSNDIFCDSYKPYSKASILSSGHDLGIWGYNANQRRIIIRNDAYIGEDGKYDIDAFNESLKDKYLYYPLATPIHSTIDPQVIRPLKGVNNIYSDANGNIEVKFWKH